MALCVLTAGWKMDGLGTSCKSSTFLDGLLAIVVDHGLRAESRVEAQVVYNRVTQLGTTSYQRDLLSYDKINSVEFSDINVQLVCYSVGIRCELASCDWINGRPKQGHLQEAARDMRCFAFFKICLISGVKMIVVDFGSNIS